MQNWVGDATAVGPFTLSPGRSSHIQIQGCAVSFGKCFLQNKNMHLEVAFTVLRTVDTVNTKAVEKTENHRKITGTRSSIPTILTINISFITLTYPYSSP